MLKKTLSPWGVGILLSLFSAEASLAGTDYYQKSRAYRVEPDPDPPAYVRNASKTPYAALQPFSWLDVGLDYRVRYEFRENDLRRRFNPDTGANLNRFRDQPDNVFLTRTRAYVGIREILDPFRFTVEYEDARSNNGRYELTDADVNNQELIQAYAELYWPKVGSGLGFEDRPLSIRAGRMALELLDRRLVANNQFRNTTNNFEGLRVHWGKPSNNWDLDLIAFNPVQRLKYDFDRPDDDTLFYGGVLSLRQWSKFITFQPYYFGRKVDNANPALRQDIRAPGLRAYGLFGDSGFDFDGNVNVQFGDRNGQDHSAYAVSLESGYTFKHPWKPRASLYYGMGTGDKSPTDNENNRFDPFFGFNQPWSRNDYFSWDNIHAPKVRLEFAPQSNLKFDMGYNAFWLESKTDGWNRANLRDRTGQSGSFIGQEIDVRFVHKATPYFDWSLSYARFWPGEFTRRQDRGNTANNMSSGPFSNQPGNFFYLEFSINAFGDGKPKAK